MLTLGISMTISDSAEKLVVVGHHFGHPDMEFVVGEAPVQFFRLSPEGNSLGPRRRPKRQP